MLKFLRSNTPNDWSDEQLLKEYLGKGQSHYLGILYERYMPMVYGVCLKIFRDSGKSEDAVMAIYEELTRKVKEHEIGNFRGWLYVLSRNHCLMELRKRENKVVNFLAPEDMARFDSAEDSFDWEITGQPDNVGKCLGELPELQQKTVKMFYYEDKSYKEIAEMLQIELGTTRSHIQNGRRNMKICLEKKER